METFVRNAAKLYFTDHRAELFGATSSFVDYFQNAQVLEVSTADLSYTFALGHIVFGDSSGSVFRHTNLLVRYFENSEREAGLLTGLMSLTRELHFWQTILPHLDQCHPIKHLFLELCVSYVHATATSNRYVVLWQRPPWTRHLEMVSVATIGYEYCSLMVRKIAQLHACSLLAKPAYDDAVFENPNSAHPGPLFFDVEPLLPMLVRCLEPLHQKPGYQLSFHQGVRRLKQMLDTFFESLAVPFSRSSAGPRCWVVCHQNYGQQSVLLKRDEAGTPVDLKLFNCQSMGLASLGVDLVVPLFVELDRPSRTTYGDMLLAEYQAQLQQSGCAVPSLQDVTAEIKKSIPYALFVLAGRIARAQAELQPENAFFRPTSWKEDRITDLYEYLIENELV